MFVNNAMPQARKFGEIEKYGQAPSLTAIVTPYMWWKGRPSLENVQQLVKIYTFLFFLLVADSYNSSGHPLWGRPHMRQPRARVVHFVEVSTVELLYLFVLRSWGHATLTLKVYNDVII